MAPSTRSYVHLGKIARWPFNIVLPLALRHLTGGQEALEKIAWDLWEPPVLDFFKEPVRKHVKNRLQRDYPSS